jgi:uncharacterized protein (UPF0548 family)
LLLSETLTLSDISGKDDVKISSNSRISVRTLQTFDDEGTLGKGRNCFEKRRENLAKFENGKMFVGLVSWSEAIENEQRYIAFGQPQLAKNCQIILVHLRTYLQNRFSFKEFQAIIILK